MAVSVFGGGNRSIPRKPPTCRKSLTNFNYNLLYKITSIIKAPLWKVFDFSLILLKYSSLLNSGYSSFSSVTWIRNSVVDLNPPPSLASTLRQYSSTFSRSRSPATDTSPVLLFMLNLNIDQEGLKKRKLRNDKTKF